MKLPFRSCSQPARFLGVAFSLAASLSVIGALMMPPAGIAATAVAVAQQPLILRPPIPPNIVLMLDDSGSMNANYMPDNPTYLSDSAMINASNNGVYYNPTVTYAPPPHADGATYPSQTDMTAVPPNGFGDTPPPGLSVSYQPVDLTKYDGRYECDHNQHCGVKADGTPNGELHFVHFSTSVTSTTAATYSETQPSNADCTEVFNSYPGRVDGSLIFNNSNSLDGSGNCRFQYYPVNYYFQYSTGPASAPVVHYVASTGQGCGALDATTTPTCVTADTAGDGSNGAPVGVTVGENIANWFAYYHTRILMAKSGLMLAMEDLPATDRFGFASINAKGADNIPSSPAPYTFDDSTSGGGSTTNKLAVVQPFGAGTDSTSQKAKFWTWIEHITPWNNTPLRKALQGVGEYYRTDQPWTSMSGDPGYVDGGTNPPLACRASYVILTTDGFWNGSDPSVGNADGVDGPSYTGLNGQTLTYPGYTAKPPYSDSYSNTLADVAMYYWNHDLQDGSLLPDGSNNFDLPNEVPPNSADPAQWQHMVTYTLGLGVTPTGITPAGTTIDQIFNWANGRGTPPDNFGWPQPSSGSPNNIADLAHAAVDGHGGFFSATNPQTFVSALKDAFNNQNLREGTGASLAANSTQLKTGTMIYQAKYTTAKWTGDLMAYSVDTVRGAIAAQPTWQVSADPPVDASTRNIQTWNGSAFVPFKIGTSTSPTLSSAQLVALGSDAAIQQNIVNYLRGDQSLEQQNGGTLRTRGWTLGDIVDSQPVFSGPPDPNEFINQTFYGTTVDSSTSTVPFYDWAVGTTDSSGFHPSAASQRTPMIFVAANDGMLHAFNATTGVETFAYLPGAVITAGLANLANPDYGKDNVPHQFYNDGQLTIADAYVQLPGDTKPQWHSILVGTTGRGTAKAVYALDVTNPGAITPLWERSAGDGQSGSNYIGQMVGKPVIAQTSYTQASGSTAASSTWSVLIGNGYNSTSGQAALLQFNLATGALSVHTTTDTTGGNGLAAPVAWMDIPANGVSTVAYAGDLHGQVWKFPLNDTTGSNPTPTSTGALLFTAKDSGGKVQPITAGMLAGKDPNNNNVWLFFGTGQYLSSADLTITSTQSWYGIIVQSSDSRRAPAVASSSTRNNLVQRTITAQTSGGIGGNPPLPARTVSTQTVNTDGTTDLTGKSGWYIDLLAPIGTGGTPVQQGERMVDPNQFQGSLLIGVTRVPQVTDVCSPSGSGWIMALDPFTGAAPSDDFFDINLDSYVNGGDRVNGGHAAGVGFNSLPNAPIFVGGIMETSFDDGTTSSLKTAGTVGTVQRVNWRELVNP